MTTNPYTPPRSDVADVEPTRLLAQRPKQIVHATLLFWGSFLMSIPLVYWDFQKSPERLAANLIALTLLFLVLVLLAAVNVAVWRGRNWARIIFLLVSAFSVVAFVVDLGETLNDSVTAIVLNVVSTAMDVAVSYLLFTKPGSLWFRTVQ